MTELLDEIMTGALPEVQPHDEHSAAGRPRKRKRVERYPIPEEEQEVLLRRVMEEEVDEMYYPAAQAAQAESLRQAMQNVQPRRPQGRRTPPSPDRSRSGSRSRDRARRRTRPSDQDDEPASEVGSVAGDERDMDPETGTRYIDHDIGHAHPPIPKETGIRPCPCIVCSWERCQLPLKFMAKADILFITLRQTILVRDPERAAVPNFLDGLHALFDVFDANGELVGCLRWYAENVTLLSVVLHYHLCSTSVVHRVKILADKLFKKMIMTMPRIVCYESAPSVAGGPDDVDVTPKYDPVQVGCMSKVMGMWTKLVTFPVQNSPFFEEESYIPNEILRVKARALVHTSKTKMGDTTPMRSQEQKTNVVYLSENATAQKLVRLLEPKTGADAQGTDPGLRGKCSTHTKAEAAWGVGQEEEDDDLESTP